MHRLYETVVTRFYRIRVPGRWGWARIWITNDYSISVLSDFGNFGYWWAPEAQEFRRFLIRISSDSYEGYLYNKFTSGRRTVCDADASLKRIKQHILDYRRDRHYTREFARAEWDLIHQCQDLNEHERVDWYDSTQLSDAHELLAYEPDNAHQIRAFLKDIWPLFIASLEEELEHEAEDFCHALDNAGIDTTDPEIIAVINL